MMFHYCSTIELFEDLKLIIEYEMVEREEMMMNVEKTLLRKEKLQRDCCYR